MPRMYRWTFRDLTRSMILLRSSLASALLRRAWSLLQSLVAHWQCQRLPWQSSRCLNQLLSGLLRNKITRSAINYNKNKTYILSCNSTLQCFCLRYTDSKMDVPRLECQTGWPSLGTCHQYLFTCQSWLREHFLALRPHQRWGGSLS